MVKEILLFVGGLAIGFGGGVLLVRDKYKTMADEEIKEAMDWAKKKVDGDKPKKKETKTEQANIRKAEVKNYNEITERYKKEANVLRESEPYRISEGDFVMDDDEYGKVTLEYYPEEEGLYENEELIPNADRIVGLDNLSLLHGVEDDTIYVRNDHLKIDYEICRMEGTFRN